METAPQSKNLASLFTFLVALFLLLAKIISCKLWLMDRTFPVIPALNFLNNIPNWAHTSLYFLSIVTLLFLVIKPSNWNALPIIIFLEIASCLLDQNRWQPWEYQYIFMFFILMVNRKNKENIPTLFLMVLCSTYFYSGFQKMNIHFINSLWRDSILRDFFHLNPVYSSQKNILRLGYIIPISELTLGLGLLLKRTRRLSILFLIGIHVFILLYIGPLGLHYNIIVWPWNVAMVMFLLVLQNANFNSFDAKKILQQKLNYIPILAWFVLPLFNFIGLWDYYFSSSLYSSRIDICNIELDNPPQNFELKKYYNPRNVNDTIYSKQTISIQNWAMKEMNTPPCPQERVYKKIKAVWEKKYPFVKAKFILINRSTNKTITSILP